jgi:hypothetical protein
MRAIIVFALVIALTVLYVIVLHDLDNLRRPHEADEEVDVGRASFIADSGRVATTPADVNANTLDIAAAALERMQS